MRFLACRGKIFPLHSKFHSGSYCSKPPQNGNLPTSTVGKNGNLPTSTVGIYPLLPPGTYPIKASNPGNVKLLQYLPNKNVKFCHVKLVPNNKIVDTNPQHRQYIPHTSPKHTSPSTVPSIYLSSIIHHDRHPQEEIQQAAKASKAKPSKELWLLPLRYFIWSYLLCRVAAK